MAKWNSRLPETKASYAIIVEGKSRQLYFQVIRSFLQYDEICKYLTERKQKDNNANEAQKHFQLQDLSIREYLTDKYALWLRLQKDQ